MVIGRLERDSLISGEYPLEAIAVTVTEKFNRGDVVAYNAAGELKLADINATDGTQNAVGVMTDNITPADGEVVTTTMFIKGEFSISHLRFAENNTVEQHERRLIEIGIIPRVTRENV